jgi:LacI family transcriptional regulator
MTRALSSTSGRTSSHANDGTRPTLAEIATEAHTSLATVSKVLNGRQGVSSAKRTQILELLEKHHYRRRGDQVRKPAHLIDLVMRGVDTLWANRILAGALTEASRAQVSLVITATHGRTLGNRHWLTTLTQRHTDGIILVADRFHTGIDVEIERLRIPYVVVDSVGIPLSGQVPIIGASNFAGGLAATDHLLGLGHTRVGIVTGPKEMTCSQERLDGYRAALARRGLPYREEFVHYGDFLVSGGRQGAEKFLRLPAPPTAIFAGSDQQAYGVYEAAKAHGLRIPQDLSVIGFDDVPLCQWVSPKLTTVRQPLEEMAQEATRILLTMAYQGVSPVKPKVELATELVVRESTAQPRP